MQESKRKDYQIKQEILEALEEFPHNESQLGKRLGTNQKTVKKHLKELESYGKVFESKVGKRQ
ncbi:MAG: ArsR family transcriptional regulator [Candidatus Nanohalobium sp.]